MPNDTNDSSSNHSWSNSRYKVRYVKSTYLHPEVLNSLWWNDLKLILAVSVLNYISSVIMCDISKNESLCEVKCLYILHSVNVSSIMFLETMEWPSLFTNLAGVKFEWAIHSSLYKFIWINGKQMFIKFAI